MAKKPGLFANIHAKRKGLRLAQVKK